MSDTTAPPIPTDPKAVLIEAAQVMRQRGFTQGRLYREDIEVGPVCAMGAVNVVCFGLPSRTQSFAQCNLSTEDYDARYEIQRQALDLVRSSTGNGIANFNDRNDGDTVIAKLEEIGRG